VPKTQCVAGLLRRSGEPSSISSSINDEVCNPWRTLLMCSVVFEGTSYQTFRASIAAFLIPFEGSAAR